ncbi:MAG TPA: Dabb family protein [Lacisediminihabitans sp.]|uniref:Dabb family protein n=1 Tax=Lacisediminihabitans sp. TaxID=2787631 RepID=UPI002ED9FBFD
MLRHVVSWKLKAEDVAAKAEDSARISAALQTLPAVIPEIRSLTVGSNAAYPETNWDLVLIADYDDAAALDVYQNHPEHRKVVAIIEPLVAARANVDFLI